MTAEYAAAPAARPEDEKALIFRPLARPPEAHEARPRLA
jgi:hypothetical protein